MTEIDDGGPAFPRPVSQNVNGDMYYEQDGMALRDVFAGQAMQAWISTYGDSADFPKGDQADIVARITYNMADAMIKARKGEK